MDLSRRLDTAAHEIVLEICYNFFFTLRRILFYSLNIYKTIPQNSLHSLKKKITKNAVLEHSNSGHPLNKDIIHMYT